MPCPCRPGATTGGTSWSTRSPTMAATERHRRRRPADDHLHLGHHRQAQGRGAHPLRLPGQGRPGHGLRHRRAARRHDLLDDRHGLDDGPLAGLRHAAARRDDVALRRRARLSRARPAVGAGRAPPGHHARRLADADPRADPARRRAGPRSTTSPRCASSPPPASRGTPSRGSGCSTRSARASARSSTTPAARRSPAASSWAIRSCRSSPAPSPAPARAWPRTWWTSTGSPVRNQVGELVIRAPWIGMTRGFWNDPAALPGDLLVALAGRLGARRLGRDRRRRPVVHPRPLRRHASRSPASASARRRSSRSWSSIRRWSKRPPSACRTRSRASAWWSSACWARAAEPGDALRPRADSQAIGRLAGQAAGAGRGGPLRAAICPRPATPRSCAA